MLAPLCALYAPAFNSVMPKGLSVASRYEAERLPQTVTSHIDPREFDAQRTDYVPLQDQDTVAAADCIPSYQWLTEFLSDFASLRAQLHQYVLPLLLCLFLALASDEHALSIFCGLIAILCK